MLRISKRKGFTLAEVLITLGVIGIVAAMTIPTLINNNQKKQYVTQLKKEYSQFNQVLTLMSTDQGCVDDLKCTGFFDPANGIEAYGNELVKYFKVVKNCGITSGGCFSNEVSDNFDGSGRYPYDTVIPKYSFITVGGASIGILNQNTYIQNCGDSRSSGVSGHLASVCEDFVVDVNGPGKGPNSFGRDMFYFYISNGKGGSLYPAGGPDDNEYWRSNGYCAEGDTTGRQCSGRIIDEGWEMNY